MAYMEFLTQVYDALKLPPPVPTGFPTIPTSTGEYCSGEKTFAQKCAVCHGLNGQGRYGGGLYFRPALWGPYSFNVSAGMFKTPLDLAEFLKSNMPLGSGGQLTDQEAWNLEAFIHGHPRPGQAPAPMPICPK